MISYLKPPLVLNILKGVPILCSQENVFQDSPIGEQISRDSHQRMDGGGGTILAYLGQLSSSSCQASAFLKNILATHLKLNFKNLIILHKGQLSTSVYGQLLSCPPQVPEAYLLPLPSVSASSRVGAAGGNSGSHLSHLKTYECFLEKKEKYLVCNMANTPSLPFPRSLLPTRFSEGRVLSHFTQ